MRRGPVRRGLIPLRRPLGAFVPLRRPLGAPALAGLVAERPRRRSLARIARRPVVSRMLMMATVVLVFMAVRESIFPLWANHEHHLNARTLGGMLAWTGTLIALVQFFGIGFLAGYLMYGAIFLALGSLCESIQEAQTLLGPVALVLALPMMLIAPALDNPNAPLIETASWFPLFTPFLLLVRAPAGLDWIEIAGMGALMAVAALIILLLAARVFKAGVVDQVSMASWRGRKQKS